MAINVGKIIITSEQPELVITQPTQSEPMLTEVVEGNDEVTTIVDHNERRRRMKENLLAETVKSSPYMDDMSVIPNYK
jgi:hypothetical protein